MIEHSNHPKLCSQLSGNTFNAQNIDLNYRFYNQMANTQQKITKEQWTIEEVELLKKLHPNYISKKWKNISQIFTQNGFNRTEVEIREKWINFVDPTISNQSWTFEELEIIYNSYQKYGSRWSLAQKELKNRTQNKIKNRFYGTLRNLIRMVVRKFDRNGDAYTLQISRLSPIVLNTIYDGQEQFSFLGHQLSNIIKKMNYQLQREQFFDRLNVKEDKYSKFYVQLMRMFKRYNKKPAKISKNNKIEPKQSEISQIQQSVMDQQLPNKTDSTGKLSQQNAQESQIYSQSHVSQVLNQMKTSEMHIPVPRHQNQQNFQVLQNILPLWLQIEANIKQILTANYL